MSGHVMRNPAPMKGRHVVGIAPLSGRPHDAQGRVILDWLYGSPPPREAAPASPLPASAPIARGVRSETLTQDSFL